MKLKVLVHEAEEGCRSVGIKDTDPTATDKVLEIAV